MRLTAGALGAIAAALLAGPVSAQEVYGGGENLYIDGSTPIDQRTRDLVDAYIIHKELRDREEAERRSRIELFIYNDRIHSSYNSSLY